MGFSLDPAWPQGVAGTARNQEMQCQVVLIERRPSLRVEDKLRYD